MQPFNVLRYQAPGQHYDSHYDIFEPESYGPQASQRVRRPPARSTLGQTISHACESHCSMMIVRLPHAAGWRFCLCGMGRHGQQWSPGMTPARLTLMP